MSDLGEIYDEVSDEQEIFIMPVRMREEKLRIPTDSPSHAVMVVDYFLEDSPLMLFAPKQIMEAWFYGAGVGPSKNMPLKIHVPGDLVSKYGGIPVLRMTFITESEYAKMVSEIQRGKVTTYRTE